MAPRPTLQNTPTMLRRKPTAITVTSEDVAAFDDERSRRSIEDHKHVDSPRVEDLKKAVVDPNDELKPLPGDNARVVRMGPTRDERIGVGR